MSASTSLARRELADWLTSLTAGAVRVEYTPAAYSVGDPDSRGNLYDVEVAEESSFNDDEQPRPFSIDHRDSDLAAALARELRRVAKVYKRLARTVEREAARQSKQRAA